MLKGSKQKQPSKKAAKKTDGDNDSDDNADDEESEEEESEPSKKVCLFAGFELKVCLKFTLKPSETFKKSSVSTGKKSISLKKKQAAGTPATWYFPSLKSVLCYCCLFFPIAFDSN